MSTGFLFAQANPQSHANDRACSRQPRTMSADASMDDQGPAQNANNRLITTPLPSELDEKAISPWPCPNELIQINRG